MTVYGSINVDYNLTTCSGGYLEDANGKSFIKPVIVGPNTIANSESLLLRVEGVWKTVTWLVNSTSIESPTLSITAPGSYTVQVQSFGECMSDISNPHLVTSAIFSSSTFSQLSSPPISSSNSDLKIGVGVFVGVFTM